LRWRALGLHETLVVETEADPRPPAGLLILTWLVALLATRRGQDPGRLNARLFPQLALECESQERPWPFRQRLSRAFLAQSAIA
jgi:hypothetical protein